MYIYIYIDMFVRSSIRPNPILVFLLNSANRFSFWLFDRFQPADSHFGFSTDFSQPTLVSAFRPISVNWLISTSKLISTSQLPRKEGQPYITGKGSFFSCWLLFFLLEGLHNWCNPAMRSSRDRVTPTMSSARMVEVKLPIAMLHQR